jgi:tetratricopeptide (TPR) repeat protein
MFRRYFLPLLASLTLIASSALVSNAQTGQVRGHVTLKQADGTIVPAAEALVDVYRTDVSGKLEAKTNKKGEFIFAALFYVGDYVIGVSMPGAQPSYYPGVKAGRDVDYAIELTPGDGRRLTLDEIKSLMSSRGGPATGGAKETSEDRAKRAELEKKNQEIAASNERAKNSNEIIGKAFKLGNDALKARNYDVAIAQYDEGINADPEHPGAPQLLTNKAVALKERAVAQYNAAISSKDDAAKTAGIEAAKKDWTAASEASAKAVTMLKAAPAPTDPAMINATKMNLYLALVTRAEVMRLFVTKVDQSQADLGMTAFQDYMAVETDPAKKSKAEHDLGMMLFDANVYEKAKPIYEKILSENPDDQDALKNVGLILYNLGFIKEAEGKKDEAKANYQEAANYLQRFVDKAPEGQVKTEIQDTLKNMKENQNVQAEKTSTPARRRRP